MEKIQFSEVEKNLPSGTPAKIRALDSSGNSIIASPGVLANTMRCLLRNNLYGNVASGAVYSKIAAMASPPNGEGVDNSLSLIVSGGNLYTSPASITIVSICVYRGSVKAAKNSLIGNQEFGYVFANGILSVWIRRSQYTHYTNVSVLSEKGDSVLVSNETVESAPAGYTIIGS